MTQKNIFKKSFLFFWNFHRKLFVSMIVSLAMVLLSLYALVFFIEKNPHIVQELVETHLQTLVTFDEMKVDVHLLYPSISMTNFTIRNKSDKNKVLEFSAASIRLNLPHSFISGHLIIDTLSLKGFNALIRRNKNGELFVADFQISDAQTSKADSQQELQSFFSILNQTNFMISESEIYFVDEMKLIPEIIISGINLKMKNNNKRHQISMLSRLNESATYLDFRLDFNGDIDNISNWDGKIYASVTNLNQQALLHYLQKDVIQIEEFQLNNIEASTKIWSTINRGKLQSVDGELIVENAFLSRVDSDKRINFETLSSNFKLGRKLESLSDSEKIDSQWMLDLYDLNISVDSKKLNDKYIHMQFQKSTSEPLAKVQMFLDKLDLTKISHVASFFLPKSVNKKAYSLLKPKGQLANVLTTFQVNPSEMPIDIQFYQVQADINNFGMNSLQALPKVRNFSAQVIFNEKLGYVSIDSLDMKLHIKSLFRDSWDFNQLSGAIFWQKEDNEWLIGAENLFIKSPHFSAHADLNFWLTKEWQVFMDLTAFYQNVEVEAISNYLPAHVMNKGLVKWLDEALISGQVPDGGIVYRGELSEFPYEAHNGNMDIVFNTQNVLLEYTKDWPKLSHIDAQVQFTQKGMKINGRQSKMFSASSQNIQVDLEDYLERMLLIKGDIKSDIDDGLKFLQQSHLLSGDVINMIDAKDDIDINLDLNIPLEQGKLDNKIRIKLNDADYFPPGFERKKGLVSHLKGDFIIHNTSINSQQLSAQIMGMPAQISLKTGPSKLNKEPDIRINIDTNISIDKLRKFDWIPEKILPLSDQLSGQSKIKLNIDLPNAQHELAFKLSSNLQGIASKLPAPFKKQAHIKFPFALNYAETKSSANKKKSSDVYLNLNLSKVLSIALLVDTKADTESFKLLKGNIAFAGDKAKLPDTNILKVTGALKHLPLEQWQSIFDKTPKPRLSLKKSSQKAMPVEPLSIPVEIEMTEIIFPQLKLAKSNTKSSKKVSADLQTNYLEPDNFPIINGYVNSLKFGALDLGRFNIQSSRVDKGIIFDELTLDGKLFLFKGKGKWHHWNSKPEVDMEGNVDIPSLEKLAIALNYDQLVRQGKAQVSGYISWPGSLADISKETIDGKLNFVVEKGAWIEGKPGAAGRLLGLLNMNAITRRLSLDFSDVSKEGFEFDMIVGDFRFQDAKAHTDNLQIHAPSAKILVRGWTGLVSEEIDQRVTVIPEVSATLPLAGAAVAGPAGAAVVWVGQKLLGDQINQVTAFDYTIKGNWDKPIIKKDKTSINTLNKFKKLFNLDGNESVLPDNEHIFDINTAELP